MYLVDVHCIEALGSPRVHLHGVIESAGTPTSPTFLCHLYDSNEALAVTGRLDDAPGPTEPQAGFVARCIAEALLVRPRLEPLSASGQGGVVVCSNTGIVAKVAFGFANGLLYSGPDLTRGESLAGNDSYWQLAQLVLALHCERIRHGSTK